MNPTHTLHTLLTQELDLAVEYERDGRASGGPRAPGDSALASHLPMALHALHALGASTALLRAWYAHASAAMPAATPWPDLSAAEQPHSDAESALHAQLPRLMPHAGSVAFHAMIRTAHALEADHQHQLHRALAWWSLRELPMPLHSAHAPMPLPAWLAALGALAPPPRAQQGLISQRMRAWSLWPPFARLAPALHLGAELPEQLARWAAGAYAASGNFTLLHVLTGTRAFLVLQPYLREEDRPPALRALSVHAAAARCASGWQASGSVPEPLAWADLLSRAMQPDQDAHAIKLVHAAWWLERRFNAPQTDTLWRQAATRAVAATTSPGTSANLPRRPNAHRRPSQHASSESHAGPQR